MPLGGCARLYAATNSDNSKPSDPLHAHCVSPNPFNIPDSLLYPLTVLYLILLLPIARSVMLFIQGTSPRRRWHNSARHAQAAEAFVLSVPNQPLKTQQLTGRQIAMGLQSTICNHISMGTQRTLMSDFRQMDFRKFLNWVRNNGKRRGAEARRDGEGDGIC